VRSSHSANIQLSLNSTPSTPDTIQYVMRHATSGSARSNPPLPYVSIVDDADSISPFNVRAGDEAKNQLRDLLGVLRCDPQEQNSGPRLVSTTRGEFTKIAIKSHNEPVFTHCSFDVRKIGSARAALGC
jgi:hypothetical protein